MRKTPERRRLIILGAGRQARNVNDICLAGGIEVEGFLDDTKTIGERVNDVPVLGRFDLAKDAHLIKEFDWIVGLGDNETRWRLSRDIRTRGGRLASVIHPTCVISPTAEVGSGVSMNVHSCVLANAQVGDYVVITSNSTIGEDCIVEEAVLIGPGCTLAGGSRVGRCALIGAGAVILDGAPVGAHSVIGAGATVISEIPPYALAVGTPARVKKGLR